MITACQRFHKTMAVMARVAPSRDGKDMDLDAGGEMESLSNGPQGPRIGSNAPLNDPR